MRLLFPALLALGFSTALSAQPLSVTVDGGDSNGKHMQCKAYLSKPLQINKDEAPRLFFTMLGTGVYTTYFSHQKNNNFYFLTIDKPGILPDEQNHDKPVVDRSSFDYYTINTLVNCAQNALYWADDNLKNPNTKIILQGHSEGTNVMINLVKRVYDNDKKILQGKVKALFLSGVVIKHMSDVLDFQFKGEERTRLMTAYKNRGADFLYKHYGVNWHWLDESLTNKSKLAELSSLAETAQTRSVPVEIFQGLRDEDVSPTDVIEFEKQNNSKPENKKITLHARYYEAPHKMNLTTIFDVNALRDYYFGN